MDFDLEQVCSTPAEEACRGALREAAEADEGPIERHSIRVFFIMDRLRRDAGVRWDREVALCAALLHEIGLYEPAGQPRFYLAHGRSSAARILDPFDWPGHRRRRCLDAVEGHHRLAPQWHAGTEVELLRLADLVDASRGSVRFGISRVWLSRLFRCVERRGLLPALVRHSLRGAPCMSSAVAGTLLNLRRSLPAPPSA